jgi:hypothetical protein
MTEERKALSSAWLSRANEAYFAYERAKAAREHAEAARPHLPKLDGSYAFSRAYITEMTALDECRRALQTHYEITVQGRKPE